MKKYFLYIIQSFKKIVIIYKKNIDKIQFKFQALWSELPSISTI
jgi:hypothetical protein